MSIQKKVKTVLFIGYLSGICAIGSFISLIALGFNFKGAITGVLMLVSIVIMVISLITFGIISRYNCKFALRTYHGRSLTSIYLFGKEGIPNNNYSDFEIGYKTLINNFGRTIDVYEIDKKIYECRIGDKTLLFDMKGWRKAEFYIYEYFLLILQIGIHNKINSSKLKKSSVAPIETLELKFSNSKKTYTLIKNFKTRPSLNFKYNLDSKQGVVRAKKVKISDFYQFNI